MVELKIVERWELIFVWNIVLKKLFVEELLEKKKKKVLTSFSHNTRIVNVANLKGDRAFIAFCRIAEASQCINSCSLLFISFLSRFWVQFSWTISLQRRKNNDSFFIWKRKNLPTFTIGSHWLNFQLNSLFHRSSWEIFLSLILH